MDWVISHSDVEKHPRYDKSNPNRNLDSILHDYGMQVSDGYYTDEREVEEVPENWPEGEPHFGYTHRSPFTGEISTGVRYVGNPRADGKWRRFVSDFLELGGDV
jgi:hypothetical protein